MSAPTLSIVAFDPDAFGQSVERLAEILHVCVGEGASVGFVLPFMLEEARAYWRDKVAPPLAAGARLVLAASVDGEVVGTAQLDFDGLPSKRHHAEVSKVLVDPRHRRRGVARALMAGIERRATDAGRWLLTLDTAGDAAEALYRSLGYTLAGTIPSYARDASRRIATTRRGSCTRTCGTGSPTRHLLASANVSPNALVECLVFTPRIAWRIGGKVWGFH